MKDRNQIRVGAKNRTLDDTRIDIQSLGKTQPAFLLIPWGLEMNVPEGVLTVILQQECNEGALFAFPTDRSNRRSVDSGEVAFGSPESSTRIKSRPDGSVTIIINGSDGGDFLARFNELKAGFDELKSNFNDLVTAYNAHTHPTAPNGPVSTPSTSGSASTASIDDAKIDEIEVPQL